MVTIGLRVGDRVMVAGGQGEGEWLCRCWHQDLVTDGGSFPTITKQRGSHKKKKKGPSRGVGSGAPESCGCSFDRLVQLPPETVPDDDGRPSLVRAIPVAWQKLKARDVRVHASKRLSAAEKAYWARFLALPEFPGFMDGSTCYVPPLHGGSKDTLSFTLHHAAGNRQRRGANPSVFEVTEQTVFTFVEPDLDLAASGDQPLNRRGSLPPAAASVVVGGLDLPFLELAQAVQLTIVHSLCSRGNVNGNSDRQLNTLDRVFRRSLERGGGGEAVVAAGAPAGVLLRGPPGVGKRSLCRSVAHRHCVPVVELVLLSGAAASGDGAEEGAGQSEAHVADTFRRANDLAAVHGACIVLAPDLERMCPKRGNDVGTMGSDHGAAAGGEFELTERGTRLVTQLLELLDGAKRRPGVLFVATSTRPALLDAAVRRPGRLDREVDLPVPKSAGRFHVLQLLCARHQFQLVPPLLSETCSGLLLFHETTHWLARIADQTVGFVGADLDRLCQRVSDSLGLTEAGGVTEQMFQRALRETTPLLMAGGPAVQVESGISWDSVGGDAGGAKQLLREAVEWPLRHGRAMARVGAQAPRGILMHGPPGCAKTTLAKAVANSSAAAFVSLDGAAVYSPWVGEAERCVRETFARARQLSPCVLFLDELDALVGNRASVDTGGRTDPGEQVSQRVLSTLLVELDGVTSGAGSDGAADDDDPSSGLLVVAATNRIDLIDSALLRPGRFDKLVFVGKPDEQARLQILNVHARELDGNDGPDPRVNSSHGAAPLIPLYEGVRTRLPVRASLKELARLTDGFSGADLEALCRHAALSTLRQSLAATKVTRADFDQALRIMRQQPSSPTKAIIPDFISPFTFK